jgi:hypothetical protein
MTKKHPRRPGVDMSVWYTGYVGKFREVWPVVMKRQELKYGFGIFDVVGIDLSLNQLVGGIPDGISSLNGLMNLNLSWNQLSGEIPAKIGLMKSIESLDLSTNNLSGEIPTSLSDLTYLSSWTCHITISKEEYHLEVNLTPCTWKIHPYTLATLVCAATLFKGIARETIH